MGNRQRPEPTAVKERPFGLLASKLKYNRNERMQNIATEPTRRACRNIGDENAARSTKGSRARRSASTNKAKAAPVTTSGTTKADGALRTLPSPCSVKTEDVITPASRRQPAQSKAPDKFAFAGPSEDFAPRNPLAATSITSATNQKITRHPR